MPSIWMYMPLILYMVDAILMGLKPHIVYQSWFWLIEIQIIGVLGDLVLLEALLDRATCHAIKDYVFIINDCIKIIL